MKGLEYFASDWHPYIKDEFSKEYMEKLRDFLRGEYQKGENIYPPKDKIFRVFSQKYQDVKVVILGQDPYHNENQACGLAFAVNTHTTSPPSLQNIFKEIKRDLGLQREESHLESWANQGVFLLNTVLTVTAHKPLSHREKGWEIFTSQVIKALGQRKEPLVFLLWGSAAHKYENLIENQHLVLKAPHPSPLSAHRGFLGCGHFSKANQFLISNGQKPIEWGPENSPD